MTFETSMDVKIAVVVTVVMTPFSLV